jgi:hypothetical protein
MQAAGALGNPSSPAAQSIQNFEVVRRHFATLAIGDELETHLVAFTQIIVTGAFDRADVDEGVAAAIVRLNEAKTFLAIEPFYGSRSHRVVFHEESDARPLSRVVEIAFSGEKSLGSARFFCATPTYLAVHRLLVGSMWA